MCWLLPQARQKVVASERKKAVLTGTFSSVGARRATFEYFILPLRRFRELNP
jgi:hypothetical protein